MATNRYRVQKKTWSKWTENARLVFNDVYSLMGDQQMFTHYGAARVPAKHWQTIRWNAAWMAADSLSHREKSLDRKISSRTARWGTTSPTEGKIAYL